MICTLYVLELLEIGRVQIKRQCTLSLRTTCAEPVEASEAISYVELIIY
jgi:hypothetical protein